MFLFHSPYQEIAIKITPVSTNVQDGNEVFHNKLDFSRCPKPMQDFTHSFIYEQMIQNVPFQRASTTGSYVTEMGKIAQSDAATHKTEEGSMMHNFKPVLLLFSNGEGTLGCCPPSPHSHHGSAVSLGNDYCKCHHQARPGSEGLSHTTLTPACSQQDSAQTTHSCNLCHGVKAEGEVPKTNYWVPSLFKCKGYFVCTILSLSLPSISQMKTVQYSKKVSRRNILLITVLQLH